MNFTVTDFEQAIDAKGGFQIKEIKLRNNKVRCAICRAADSVYVFDNKGRAYAAIQPDRDKEDEVMLKPTGIYAGEKLVTINGELAKRIKQADLKL